MNIENPMVLDQEYYDSQMQEPEKKYCSYCEEWVDKQHMKRYGDVEVCDLCEAQFLKDSAEDIHFDSFIMERWTDYLFWWFQRLSDLERKGILESAYQRQLELEKFSGSTLLEDDRVRYCTEHDEQFIYHLREALE